MTEYGGHIDVAEFAGLYELIMETESIIQKIAESVVKEADKKILEDALWFDKHISHGERNRIRRGLKPRYLWIYRVLDKAKELGMI